MTGIGESVSIQINVEAPIFDTVDIYGNRINLSEYKGKKVFIGFFRHAGCPFCNLRLKLLQKMKEEFSALNLEMIFFFESGKELLLDSRFHQKVSPTPIISDPEKIWYQVYGLQESLLKSLYSHLTSFITTAIQAKIKSLPVHRMKDGESIKTMPAEFLLDENLRIQKIHYSDGLNDRIEIKDILAFAQQSSQVLV